MSAGDSLVWADGALLPRGSGVVRADDAGFLLGRAAFETLLWEEGVLYFVDEHLARLEEGAAALGLSTPRWSPRRALEEFCAALDAAPRAVRVTWTAGTPDEGPSLIVSARPQPPLDPPEVGVVLVERAKLSGDPHESWKTSSRLRNALARERALAAGAWEALLGTEEGDFVEGCVSNLFVVKQGRALTPPLERGALAGTLRGFLLEAGAAAGLQVGEALVTREDLAEAQEVFLTNSLVRVAPVSRIGGLRDDLPGARGPVTRAARECIRDLEARYRAERG